MENDSIPFRGSERTMDTNGTKEDVIDEIIKRRNGWEGK